MFKKYIIRISIIYIARTSAHVIRNRYICIWLSRYEQGLRFTVSASPHPKNKTTILRNRKHITFFGSRWPSRTLLSFFILTAILTTCIPSYASNISIAKIFTQDSIAQTPYSYALIIPYGYKPSPMVDSTFYRSAKGVIFPVNKYNLNRQDPWLQELAQKVAPWAEANRLQLRYVEMRGASSPEGPMRWNDFLAEKRSRALTTQLNTIFGITNEPLQIQASPEDYKALLFMMREAHDSDYDRVATIIQRHEGNRAVTKRILRSADNGRLWQRIFRRYFAHIRYARVMLYFEPLDPPAPPQPPTPVVVPVKPEEPIAKVDTIKPIVEIIPAIPLQPAIKAPRYRRELLSVKTNLPELGAYVPQYGWCPMPNVAIEYYPLHGHFTYGASIDFPWWIGNTTNHKYFELRNYQLETRYYFRSGDINLREPGKGAAFKGLYLQAYAHAFLYQIGFTDRKGWIGEGAGAGIGAGYVIPLGHREHWRLELGAQFGAFITKYDPFVYGCPIHNIEDGKYYYNWTGKSRDFRKRQYTFTWFGPTRISISLSYDLLYRKSPKGMSLKEKEKGGKQ